MKTGEIIDRIRALYSKGVSSQDSRLTPRHVYNKMLSARSFLLTRKYNKKQPLSGWDYQTLGYIKLTKVKESDCKYADLGCDVLRSVCKIPKPISTLDGPLIQSVSTIHGKVLFSEDTWNSKKYSKGNKYTSNDPSFMFRDEYLYILGMDRMKVVSMTAVFEDPVKVDEFINSSCMECNESSADSECISAFDVEFPIEDSMIDPLVELCVQELVIMFNQSIHDILNNGNDESQEPQQEQKAR